MSRPLYRVRDLRWHLGADFTLEIPALDLPAGQTTAVLGRSASGKSTLLSLLGRVEGTYFERAPDLSGEIWLDLGATVSGSNGSNGSNDAGTTDAGPDDTRANDAERFELLGLGERELLRRRLRGPRVGYVFQREGLFPGLSPVDNVVWPLTACGVDEGVARARARALLDRVGLPETRTVATLSGGERKRLALARALAFEPAVLLLDEPLTGLDPEALGGLLGLLGAIAADPDRTIIIVTHQRDDVERLADHVVFMDRGRVVAAGDRAATAERLARFFAGDLDLRPAEAALMPPEPLP